MLPLVAAVLWLGVAVMVLLLPGFYLYSPASGTVKLLSFLGVCGLATYYHNLEPANILLAEVKAYPSLHPWKTLLYACMLCYPFAAVQQKLRYARLDALMDKYGFTEDPNTFRKMSIEVAQEVEANIAEYEFPRLYQFAWISDFLRVSLKTSLSKHPANSSRLQQTQEYLVRSFARDIWSTLIQWWNMSASRPQFI